MLDIEDWNRIAYLHHRLGDFMEAEPIYRQTLAKCERVWSRRHKSTLSTNFDLGNTYLGQGKTAEAEQMLPTGIGRI
jgi:hypothetical protein